MTRRQQIIEILQENKQTAQQLANYFQCELKDIVEDLQHIEKSIKPKKLKILLPGQYNYCVDKTKSGNSCMYFMKF